MGLSPTAVSRACLAAALAAGCQTYEFEPAPPHAVAETTVSRRVVARRLAPDLMLVVDRSGSMGTAMAGGGTRLSALQEAMSGFLAAYGSKVRVGLAEFPSPAAADGCAPTGSVEVPIPASADVPAELTAAAEEVRGSLSRLTSGGGTPLAASLRYVQGYFSTLVADSARDDALRDKVVLVLTDGQPNCNQQNPNQCCGAVDMQACSRAACRCTQAACPASSCAIGCLDDAASVAAVTSLGEGGVHTVVVGFGAETAIGLARDVLDALAEAGGFARACPAGTDAECAPGTCDTATLRCSTRYYQADDGAALAKALSEIGGCLPVDCVWALDSPPSDPRFLAVEVDGLATPPGPDTWSYGAGKVTFAGKMCERLMESTAAAPVKVEFRTLEAL